jgi:hypothetical protein
MKKHQLAGMQNNMKRGWLRFLFSTSLSKNLCLILAWRQKAATAFITHYETISDKAFLRAFISSSEAPGPG